MGQILYGGQAVIEGVMMRGRHFMACAVREGTGRIVVKREGLPEAIYRGPWSRIPFLRAITVLSDTLVLGTRMLMFSANIAAAEELAKEDQGKGLGASLPENGRPEGPVPAAGTTVELAPSKPVIREAEAEHAIPAAATYGTLAISLALGVGLFFVLPLLIVHWFDPFIPSALLSNVLEGVIRLVLLLGYIWLIGRIPDVRRIFQYHGAEHKTIAAFEAGAPLDPETIQHYSKEHPRCGTGFLLTVVVVSIFVFALFGRPDLWVRTISRILLIPVVAAVSYELIRFSSQHRSNPVLDWLVTRPSLALQSLTTREPENQMIQVAVAAFDQVHGEEVALEKE